MYADMKACVYMCVEINQRGITIQEWFLRSHKPFCKAESFIGPKPAEESSLPGQGTPGTHFSLQPQCWAYMWTPQYLNFCVGSGNWTQVTMFAKQVTDLLSYYYSSHGNILIIIKEPNKSLHLKVYCRSTLFQALCQSRVCVPTCSA